MTQISTETASTGTATGQGGAQTGQQGQGSTGSGIAEHWAKEWVQPDFSLNHKALDRLPEHLKGLRPTLERQNNFEGVLMTLDHANQVAGKKALAPLPENATEQQRADRKAILDMAVGVPKEAKEYGIVKPADLPDAQWNPKMADAYATWAHKHSVSPAAAKELLGIQVGTIKEQLAAQATYETQFWAQEQQAFEGLLKRENIALDRGQALVEKGAAAMGLNLEDKKTQTFLKGADARTILMRHALAIGEDRTITASTDTTAGGRNYQEQAKSILSNTADPLHAPFWNKEGKFSRSDQEAAQTKYQELLRLHLQQEQKQGGRR